eukprot:SAG11_NODE_1786_length_4258_cov_1.965617_10_plen_194_part_00
MASLPRAIDPCFRRNYCGQVGNRGGVLVLSGEALRLPDAELRAAAQQHVHSYMAPTDGHSLETMVEALRDGEEEGDGDAVLALEGEVELVVADVLKNRMSQGLSLDYLPVRSELARALGRESLRTVDKAALSNALEQLHVAVAAGGAQSSLLHLVRRLKNFIIDQEANTLSPQLDPCKFCILDISRSNMAFYI